MKRAAALVWLAPAVAAVLLGAGAPDRPRKAPTPTPTPALDEEETPTPTPTPEPPRFLASLQSSQGDGGERVALFADGALVRSTRWKGRTVTTRLVLSREEMEVLKRVLLEALAATDEETPRGDVLSRTSERKMKMEIAPPAGGEPRTFLFDDVTALPLAAGRARGALEDLRSRFQSKSPIGDPGWDPGAVAVGDRLRRKSDGRWFVVTRDDSFERNLELKDEEGGSVVWFARDQVPKAFHDPSQPSPDPAPPEQPR